MSSNKTLLELVSELKQLREQRAIRTGITLQDADLDQIIQEIEEKAKILSSQVFNVAVKSFNAGFDSGALIKRR